MRFTAVTEAQVDAELDIRAELLAPNGYLHAATVIALADTACGYGCLAHLPAGADNFTTIELKSNFLGTAARRHDRLRRDAGSPGQCDAGLGCGRPRPRYGQENRAVPLHADGVVAAQRGDGGPPNVTLRVRGTRSRANRSFFVKCLTSGRRDDAARSPYDGGHSTGGA